MPLLATKFHIQGPRRNLVSRQALIDQLNAGLDRKLTLASAPAGFGKTTVIGEWIESLRSHSAPDGNTLPVVAWLSLDEGDNDYARFLTYFIGALQYACSENGLLTGIGDSALELLRVPNQPHEETLTPLINEIAALSGKLILVLDDYHFVGADSIHGAISFFIDHMPSNLHLVLTTRQDPPLPIARLRARAQVTELRALDLRFSGSEVARFMIQTMGVELSDESIGKLEGRTEGWVAGLQLAAISLQGRKDVPAFIESFAGSHRHVTDYLLHEVLSRQPKDLQRFLLQTSILDRLSGPVCDAVTQGVGGQAVLEAIDRANLFLVRLDSERNWFRFHHLFAELLRMQLQLTHPEQLPGLNKRAAEWYAANGLIREAIEHALQAGEFEMAMHLMESDADEAWNNAYTRMVRWIECLPSELADSSPLLSIIRAHLLCVAGDHTGAERSIQAADRVIAANTGLSAGSPDALVWEKLRGRLAAVRAIQSSFVGDLPGIQNHGNEALALLPEEDGIWRNVVALAVGNVHGYLGNMSAAYEARWEALQACKAAGAVALCIVASLNVAITVREQGQLRRTVQICDEEIRVATGRGLSQSKLVGYALAVQGEALAEMNEMEKALACATRGVELVERAVDMSMRGWGYMCMVRVLYSAGDTGSAMQIIARARDVGRESIVPPWVLSQMSAWEARIRLDEGDLAASSKWMSESGMSTSGIDTVTPPERADFFSMFDYIVAARVMLAKGEIDASILLLKRLLEIAQSGDRKTRQIEINLLLARALDESGDLGSAMDALELSLVTAEPEGFVRIYLDEGAPAARLLYEAGTRGIAPDYVRRLLAEVGQTESDRAATGAETTQAPVGSVGAQPVALEALSKREIEVLRLLAEGLSTQDVGDRLFISPHTIKAHSRSIYAKLESHNRVEAIAKARSLGLLGFE